MSALVSIFCRVALALVLSTLTAVIGGRAMAHEVLPAIADMEQQGEVLAFSVDVPVEGLIAGVNLSEFADTNDAPEAADYDALRALAPEALEERFTAFWPEMAARIVVRAEDTVLPLTLTGIEVPEAPDLEIARTSTITFTAALPEGAEIVQVGWDRAFGTLVLRQNGVEAPYDGYLEAGALSDPIPLAGGGQVGPWQAFLNYIPVGFDHIVPLGLDHILFVLGLFFLSTKFGPLLWQVTSFTVAHTITLALAALGIVQVSPSIVEPIIAASIVFVAVENIFSRGLSPWRPVIVFGFGLLHGLGFASVLGEFGLPPGSFVPALIGFNIGVELGQLFVIAVAFLVVVWAIRIDEGEDGAGGTRALYGLLTLAFLGAGWLAARTWPGAEISPLTFALPLAALSFLCLLSVQFRDQLEAYRRMVSIPASTAIGLIGAWWVIERVFL